MQHHQANICPRFLSGIVLAVFLVFSSLLLHGCQSKQKSTEQVSGDQPSQEDITDTQAGERVILFFGNSLTAGYQLEEGKAFPALLQQRLDSLDAGYTVVNAGLSGETTSGGVNRIDWVLRQPIEVFVLELGANDALRGLDVGETEKNLRTILDKVREKDPDIDLVIAGMKAPPNMGPEYTRKFNSIFPRLAKDYHAALIPFLLEGVAADPDLNLPDGIHPNARGHRVVMENVWEILRDIVISS